MTAEPKKILSKVPEVTLIFWIIKVLATTLGETGGDTLSMSMLASLAAAYYRTKIPHAVLFWMAFILTRPLGAVVGDFLDKPVAHGGLALSRYSASATLIALIAFFIFAFSHRPATKTH